MRLRTSFSCTLIIASLHGTLIAQSGRSASPMPDAVIIGEDTYFDFGPPFDYYEIFTLEATSTGTAVERITVTPPGDACLQPAQVQTATAILPQTLSQLLGNRSPCSIPEKALRRETKRCKHCAKFSGAIITMQVSCGGRDRLLPFSVLERDWFDKQPDTPQNTSQMLTILSSLNSALGSNVMDRPMFATGESTPQVPTQASVHLEDLSSGKFDVLFPGTLDKVSELYQESQAYHQPPTVTLAKDSELNPLKATLPPYPPIARSAHIEGDVVLKINVRPDGTVNTVTAESGPEMLKNGAINSAKTWIFPNDEMSRSISVDLVYRLNCADVTTHSSASK